MQLTHKIALSVLICNLLLAGCERSSVPSPVSRAQSSASPAGNLTPIAPLDACSLLSTEEVAETQGSSVTGTKGSNSAPEPFVVSQCYFATAETNSSVSLVVTQSNPNAAHPKQVTDYWKETFGRVRGGDKEEESGAEKAEREGGEENEKTPTAERIEGLGDDAYWAGNTFGGALYVLKKDVMLRLSLGGPGEAGVKLARSKALAAKALSKL